MKDLLSLSTERKPRNSRNQRNTTEAGILADRSRRVFALLLIPWNSAPLRGFRGEGSGQQILRLRSG